MRNHAKQLELIRRRHPEWREHQLRWRWLLDSYEGGERYRQAIYGYDRRGLPIRNLIRHKREYPDPRDAGTLLGEAPGGMGIDPASAATDDDFELRRARTPVPTFVAEAVEAQLSRIYAREVRRTAPEDIRRWWNDVDGTGSDIDYWMSEHVAPLLLVLGQIDVCIDHPAAPADAQINTRAEEEALGLNRATAHVILPQDLVWWRLDSTGSRYEQCLVREPQETDSGTIDQYRLWTATESTLYADNGQVLETKPHDHGQVPIIRLFDRRKSRCRNIGQSRCEGIAERQREYYNRDSELILSDTTQAHPLLQGPEDYVQADGTIPIGPSWLLPKKKNISGGSTTYEGFDIVDFPKDSAESIRKNKADLRDDVDRDTALIRPSVREGSPLSGVAKMIDHSDGNNRLAKIARVLARAEVQIAELARVVMKCIDDESSEPDTISVVYPTEFDFYTASDVASAASDLQSLAASSGNLPTTEKFLLSRLLRLCLPGQTDAQYESCDAELETFLLSRRNPTMPDPTVAP